MPAAEGLALREKLAALAADPNGSHPWAKSFGKGAGRVRQGDWRAVYEIQGQTMTIVKVANRKEIYR